MKGLILLSLLAGIAVSEPIRHKVGAVGPSVRSPVGECPEKDPANPVYLPDSDSCHLYYECSNGVAVQNNCAGDLEFNPSSHICDFPISSGCTAPDHQSTNPPPTTTDAIFDFDVLDDEVEEYDVVGTCPIHDTNDTVFLPDNKNCSVYYVCSNGRPIALACPENMEFSPSQHVCVFAIDSDCVPQEEMSGYQGPSPRKPVGQCPEHDPANPVFLPDDSNCQFYYECSNGVPVENTCAAGLVWSVAVNTCVEPNTCNNCNPACEASSSTSSTSSSTEETTLTTE